MSVIIAGGGIGGLALALSLHQIGVPVRVLERVERIRPLGVGINLQPHAVRELTELGLLDELDKIGLRTAEVAYFSKHGKPIWSEPRGEAAGYRWPQFSIHRGALQMLLLRSVQERMPTGTLRTGAMVTDWTSGPDGVDVAVETSSGTETLAGDLLIAVDGIHSTIRAKLYPDEGGPAWGGTVMWRGVTRGPRYLTGRSIAFAGTKRVKWVGYPIADTDNGSLINWIADLHFPKDHLWRKEDWNRQGVLDDFLPRFADWHFPWLDIPLTIRSADQILEYPMVDRDPLERWTFDRVTLLGDAAHAMYPIGSNGASQAILDARVLAREIAQHGPTEAALQAYEATRRPATSALVLANRSDGPDQVLDVVDARAPDGFVTIEDVMKPGELETMAADYKKIAGMDVEALNARASILSAIC